MKNKTSIPIKRYSKISQTPDKEIQKKHNILFLVSSPSTLNSQSRKKRISEIKQDLADYRTNIIALIKFFMGFDERRNFKRHFSSRDYQSDATKDKRLFWTLLNIRERVSQLKQELLMLKRKGK